MVYSALQMGSVGANVSLHGSDQSTMWGGCGGGGSVIRLFIHKTCVAPRHGRGPRLRVNA